MKANNVGIDSVDGILGGGVVNRGIVEFWGDEQSGKTGTAITAGNSFEHVFFFDIDGTFPWELKNTIAGSHERFNVIDIRSDEQWIDSMSISYPDNSLLVFDPISVISPYIVSNYVHKMPHNVTVIFVSHSNSRNNSPIDSTASMFCAQRMQFRYVDKILDKKDKKNVLGFRTQIKTMKNILIPPRVSSMMEVYFGIGAK
jgi:RecA/RadA recombinase